MTAGCAPCGHGFGTCSTDELGEFLDGQLARDLMELPAAAFDDALVTDVYKPRMHQVLPAAGQASEPAAALAAAAAGPSAAPRIHVAACCGAVAAPQRHAAQNIT
jgi:hypothetical protein